MLEKKVKAINDFDDLVTMCRHNFPILADYINDNGADIKELFKKNRHKASKLGLFLTIAAGLVYVIYNESEKATMKEALIALDKRQRGLDAYAPTEDEGEALDPTFV